MPQPRTGRDGPNTARRLAEEEKKRGLSLNKEKTRIGRIDAGFDFLSFNIRRYHVRTGTKVLTRPSRDALKKIRRRNAEELRALRGASPTEVIMKMNPIIRGQANYYRSGASKKAYQSLDDHLWQHLHKYAWTAIVRHVPVAGRNSPDDPALARYWADRRRRRKPPQLAPSWQHALRVQHGQCPLCRQPLLYTDRTPDSLSQWETWYATIRKAMTRQAIAEQDSGRTKHRLVHAHCARRHPAARPQGTDQKTADACPPTRAA